MERVRARWGERVSPSAGWIGNAVLDVEWDMLWDEEKLVIRVKSLTMFGGGSFLALFCLGV